MNDPRSSNGRGGAAKQATTTVSDLGTDKESGKTSERSHVDSRAYLLSTKDTKGTKRRF